MDKYIKQYLRIHYRNRQDINMAKLTLIVLGIALAVQAIAAYELAVPVFKQPYGDGDATHIIAGETAKKGQFPYQAAMTMDDSYFCGGALISKSWVLTAGHCVDGIRKWAVVLGGQNIKEPTEPGRITIVSNKAFLHESYDSQTISNDIAVVSLPKEAELNEQINVIPLPPRSFKSENFVGKSVRVSGWGKTSDSSFGISPTLQFVDLIIADLEVCQKVYGDLMSPTQFCVVGEGQKSTCNGDSGGALTIGADKNLTHLGIVSFGSIKGCSKGYPTGFTATHAFVDWVSNKTGIEVHDY